MVLAFNIFSAITLFALIYTKFDINLNILKKENVEKVTNFFTIFKQKGEGNKCPKNLKTKI